MKPPVLNFSDEANGVFYAPMRHFLEQFKELSKIPYKTEFSMFPFMEAMQFRLKETQCEMTAHMLPQINELEKKIKESGGNLDEETKESVEGLTNALLPSMFFQGENSFVLPAICKRIRLYNLLTTGIMES